MQVFRKIGWIGMLFLMFGCVARKDNDTALPKGANTSGKPVFKLSNSYTFSLDLGPSKMPVRMEIDNLTSGKYYGIIRNADEQIQTNPFRFKGDSVFINIPFFNSEFQALMNYSDDHSHVKSMTGVWRNYMKTGRYEIPFVGSITTSCNQPDISIESKYKTEQLTGRWEVTFSPGTENEYKSVGFFNSGKNKLTGTFLTETGDYRFLEGNSNGIDSASLSCFDGSHAFYFSFIPDGDTLRGVFYSGKHWKEPWVAVRNDKFELADPESLTFIKEGFTGLQFSFPNLDNEKVDFPSEKYNNKVTIIQLMGSWCPNCVDETRVLTDFYNKYNADGLEVIALCFEPSDDFEKAKEGILLHKNYFNAPYPFLIAGKSNTKSAAEALPMLNHVMSFPTTIFIDKKGNVRKIYTGFYGPGTGAYYDRYLEQTTSFIEKLLQE